MTIPPTHYRGRFAPSPSGPLHAGSLLAAVASFVDARAHHGQWLVRMEDIDPPREMPGADRWILDALHLHGLQWDGPVLYQSARHARYREVLDHLLVRGLAYRCCCSRQRLAELGRCYDGHCRDHPPAATAACALRLKTHDLPSGETDNETIHFVDRIQGEVRSVLSQDGGDFVIHRKDGLFAYQLAVVVDDMDQGVTDVVRGSDILESTARQLYLMRLLGGRLPSYAHVPVVLGQDGQKLSKQNRAAPIDLTTPAHNVCQALRQLGQAVPISLAQETPRTVLDWAVQQWQPGNIPRRMAITA